MPPVLPAELPKLPPEEVPTRDSGEDDRRVGMEAAPELVRERDPLLGERTRFPRGGLAADTEGDGEEEGTALKGCDALGRLDEALIGDWDRG